MDKMFFIINAIDLAEDEEEKQTVGQYVSDQLIKYGIRKPHLYPLSSLLALKEIESSEQHNLSGMREFQQDFFHFISNDLTEMTIRNAAKEIERVKSLIAKLIQSSAAGEAVKEEKRKNIEKQKQAIKAILQAESVDTIQARLKQESEELVYYIKQRVFLRFSDFFKESFNPSVLKDDGRNLKKTLKAALDDFLESFGYDFAQEMRATTVRLERHLERVMTDYQSALLRNIKDINEDVSFSSLEMQFEKEIDFPTAFVNLDPQLFIKAMSYFKNPKSFFEKNEKKMMSEELERVLLNSAENYLAEQSVRLYEHYATVLTEEFNRLLTLAGDETENFYFSLLSALDGGVPIERLIEIEANII
jgi:hypothetical protein